MNTNNTTNTPTPWHPNLASICSVDGLHISAIEGYGMTPEQNAANREFICTAVNAHAELKEALKALLAWAEGANNRLPMPSFLDDYDKGYGCNPETIAEFKTARNLLKSL